MKLIERDFYLKKLESARGTPDIKVITGIRRSGKSKLLEAFSESIAQNNPSANIISINFNLPEFDNLLEYRALYDYIKSAYTAGADNYVFIDEVQMCKGFEKAVNGLHATEKFDIYITGSNAFLLSSDLATLFTGRTFEIKVFPFSFDEFMKYYELDERFPAFERYLYEGGMSGSYVYTDIEDKYEYITEIFNTLIVRDIKEKYGIRNMTLMNSLIDFLLDNVSNLSSPNKISSLIEGESNHKTVGQYMDYLTAAFAFYRVRRYDIKGKKYLQSNDKYYLCDHSFRYAKLGTKNQDYGRMMENIVAVELLRRGYEVYAGVLYSAEIDFVAVKRNEKIYIQVSDNIENEKTFERETQSLLAVNDAYPKLLIARTHHDDYIYEGIRITDIANWLLDK